MGAPIAGAGAVFFLAHDVPAGTPVGPFYGPAAAAGDGLGSSLATGLVDDQPGDDIAIGAPAAPFGGIPNAGKVMVLYGRPAPDYFERTLTAPPIFSISPSPGTRFGAAVAILDVTGDGLGEVAVGAPMEPTVPGGQVEVHSLGFHGTAGHVASAADPFSTTGSAEFGAAIATGDFDQDGLDDMAVGAPDPTATGHVVVLRTLAGPPISLSHVTTLLDAPPAAGARFGDAVLAAAIDGGSDLDLVVGSPLAVRSGQAGAGSLTLFFGAAGAGFSGGAPGDVYGAGVPAAGEGFGTSLAHAVLAGSPADSFADLAVGVPGRAGRGAVEVLRSQTQ
jgi:hypothetical protein